MLTAKDSLEITISHIEITISHIEITISYIEGTISHIEITIFQIEITISHSEIAISNKLGCASFKLLVWLKFTKAIHILLESVLDVPRKLPLKFH